MGYIPPERRAEKSNGDIICEMCNGDVAAGERYIHVLSTHVAVCLSCCDALAASAELARTEET